MPAPEIEAYRFGRVVIDGQAHNKDSIVLSDRVVGGWWRKERHALHPDDLEAVFEVMPKVLVARQGAYNRMQITGEASQALQAAGIKIVSLRTQKAVETHNILRKMQAVAAALHLTCWGVCHRCVIGRLVN